MKRILIALSLLVALSGCAGGPPLEGTPNDYYANDHFRLDDYDTDVHILAAYGISLTTSELVYTKFHMTKLESTLLGIMVAGGAGTCKEVLHDAYTSRTDLKAWWLGALTGGLTFNIINF